MVHKNNSGQNGSIILFIQIRSLVGTIMLMFILVRWTWSMTCMHLIHLQLANFDPFNYYTMTMHNETSVRNLEVL